MNSKSLSCRSMCCWLIVIGAIACRDKAPTAGNEAHATSTPNVAPTPPSTASTATAASPSLEETEVRSLLTAWLATQNDGDFEAYAALYAQKFEGVKRSGERVYTFDREGWLKDRKRMFEKPMTVSADDTQVIATRAFATITLRQRWSSGVYSDVGDKRLQLAKDQGTWRIGSEAMLVSKVAGEVVVKAPPPAEFMLVVSAGDAGYARSAGYVVLDDNADPAIATRDAATLLGGDYNAAALKTVRPASLPAQASAVIGASFHVYGASGRVCTATVESPRLMRQVVGGALAFSGGDFGENRAQQAQAVWDIGDGHTMLVAELHAKSGSCDKALWARAANLPAPRVFAPVEPINEQQQVAGLNAFRRLPAYQTATRQLRDEGVKLSANEAWEAEGNLLVEQWRADDRVFETILAERGGCSEPYASAWTLLEVSGRGDATSVVPMAGSMPDEFRTSAVIDFDNDGAVELIGHTSRSEAFMLLRIVKGHLVPTIRAQRTFIGCHC